MGIHSRPVNPVAIGKLTDTSTTPILLDQTIGLSSGEESLSVLDPPNHRAAMVPIQRAFRTPQLAVDSSIPARD